MKKLHAFALISLGLTSILATTVAQAVELPAGTELARKQDFGYNITNAPLTLDPNYLQYSNAMDVDRSIFDTLTRQGPDGKFIGVAATSWQVSDDGLTWTFHLRPEAKWQDGKPVVAQNFVDSWRRLVDHNSGSPYSDYLIHMHVKNAKAVNMGSLDYVDLGVKAVDKYTLVITLDQPTPWLIQMLSLPVLAPVRMDLINKYSRAWDDADHIVGNGPYKLTEMNDDYLELTKDDNYWDAKNIIIEKVRADFNTELTNNYYRYLQGKYFISNIPVQYRERIKEERPNELVEVKKPLTRYYAVNPATIKDTTVRKALNMLLNRPVIVKTMQGTDTPTTTFTPNYIVGAQDITENPELNIDYTQQLEKVDKLLADAGYTADKPYNLSVLMVNTPYFKKLYNLVSGMWNYNSNSRLHVTNEIVSHEEFNKRIHSRKFDVAFIGWIADYNQASSFLDVYLCDNSNNLTGYCNKEYDQLVHQANINPDPATRAKLYAQADKLLTDSNTVLPLWHGTQDILVSPGLGGYNPKNFDHYIRDYYIIKDKFPKIIH